MPQMHWHIDKQLYDLYIPFVPITVLRSSIEVIYVFRGKRQKKRPALYMQSMHLIISHSVF